MNKFWKALGITVLAAAVPIRMRKDEKTGKSSIQSLLLEVETIPNEDNKTEININLLDGVLTAALSRLLSGKKEKEYFADDDPAAASNGIIDFAQAASQARAAAEDARDAAEEAQDAAEEAVLAAEEAEAIAVELEAAVDADLDEENVTEEDFDPEG